MNMPKSFVAISPEGQKPTEDTGNKPVIDAAKWWQALGDQELDSLIDRAIHDNPIWKSPWTGCRKRGLQKSSSWDSFA